MLTTELACQEGVERRYVSARLDKDEILLDCQDLGPTVRETFGDSDYEFGIRIARDDMARFAYALIVKHYSGDLQAVDRIRELAVEAGIDPHYWSFA